MASNFVDEVYAQAYEEAIKTIAQPYGGEASQAFRDALNEGQITGRDFADAMTSAGYAVETYADPDSGKTLIKSVSKVSIDPAPSDNVVATINSNTQTGTSGAGTQGSYYTEQPFGTEGDGTATGPVKYSDIKKYKNGTQETGGSQNVGAGNKILKVGGGVLQTILAYGVGLNLGKTVEKALYSADPDFWDAHGLENLDPDTWPEISREIDSPVGRFAFNILAGTETAPDGTTTATLYAEDTAQAYFAKWLQLMGFYDTETDAINTKFEPSVGTYLIDSRLTAPFSFYPISNGTYESYINALRISGGKNMFAYLYNQNNQGVIISDSPFVCEVRTFTSDNWIISGFTQVHHVEANDAHGEYYYCDLSTILSGNDTLKGLVPIMSAAQATNSNIGNAAYSAANILFYNKNKTKVSKPLDGVENQTGATVFDPTSQGLTDDSTVEDWKKAMREVLPDLWNNRVEVTQAQPDGSTKTFTYIPLPIGSLLNNDNPNQPYNDPTIDNQEQPQAQPEINPKNATDTQIATLLALLLKDYPLTSTGQPNPTIQPDPTAYVDPKTLIETDPEGKTKIKTPDPPINPPTGGGGDTPIVALPQGQASSLYAIYNPTLSQVNSLGAWLWSSDFIDQILKLFSDPMQAIIGLHKIYCTPATGAEQNIKVGYLDSGVSSKVVTDQYTTVDCGSINLFEYFGNVFDYDPYTQLRLYLPFIGIVDIDTADAMRGVIHVVYHVDVLSGACLAEVRIQRDAAGGTLYQYAGNAAVTMPISSGSYIGVIANVVGVASSAIGGFASGGVAGGIAGGVTGALTRRGGTQIQHSGNFSGNAGAMGIKKPYLIIERPQTALAKNYQNYIGNPSNETVVLSSCTGYIKVKEVHLENVPATQTELDQIEQELKAGVII